MARVLFVVSGWYVSIILVLVKPNAFSVVQHQKFEVTASKCFSNGIEIITESVSSFVSCAAMCTIFETCLSATYDKQDRKCRLCSRFRSETENSTTEVLMEKTFSVGHVCESTTGSDVDFSTTNATSNTITNTDTSTVDTDTAGNNYLPSTSLSLSDMNTVSVNIDTQTTASHVVTRSTGNYVETSTTGNYYQPTSFSLITSEPKDCSDLPADSQSGVYTFDSYGTNMTVYCDVTSGDRWTVLQRRFDGTTSFYRTWEEYKVGFGDISSEFWLGNELLHNLTSNRNYTIRFDLEDFEGDTSYADYSVFRVGDEDSNYTIEISGYNGTAGDGMYKTDGMLFSTTDVDNDRDISTHCARDKSKGGWWYRHCTFVNLNGVYKEAGYKGTDAINWRLWRNTSSLKSTMMKIKPY